MYLKTIPFHLALNLIMKLVIVDENKHYKTQWKIFTDVGKHILQIWLPILPPVHTFLWFQVSVKIDKHHVWMDTSKPPSEQLQLVVSLIDLVLSLDSNMTSCRKNGNNFIKWPIQFPDQFWVV